MLSNVFISIMSVYKNKKNGKWYYNFMIDGERYHRAIKQPIKDHKEAKTVEILAKTEILKGKENTVGIMLEDMTKKYLDYSKLNKSSYTHDKMYVEYWKEYFGTKNIAKIKPIDIEGYKVHRDNAGKKAATINRELNSLSKMFSIAKQNGFITKNPCSEVKKLRVENYKIRYLTKDEEQRLFEAIGDHWIKPIVIIGLQTGMRKGEILNLTWNCVDFTQNIIDVLKTKSGKPRKIPMSKKLKDVLKSISQESEFVFINPTTKGVPQNINDVFPDFLKKAKIKNFRFHDLRHTVATRWVESGIDLVVVKELLGHADIKTTMRYAHALPEIKLKAVEALSQY